MATDKREGSFNSHGVPPLLLWGLILGKVKEIMGVRCWQLFVTFFDCCFDSLSPGKTQQAVVWNAYCDMMQLFFSNKTPPSMPEEGVGGVSSAGVWAQFWCSCIIKLFACLTPVMAWLPSNQTVIWILNPVLPLRMVGPTFCLNLEQKLSLHCSFDLYFKAQQPLLECPRSTHSHLKALHGTTIWSVLSKLRSTGDIFGAGCPCSRGLLQFILLV